MIVELDDGYQFGIGAFETISLINGVPVFLEEHLNRLNKSLAFFNIEFEVSKEAVLYRIKSDMNSYAEVPDTGVLKILVSEKNQIFNYRENPYSKEKLEKGFNLEYSRIRRNESSPLTMHKSFNYGDNIMEKRRIKGSSVDEVVFLNTRGEICEGSTSNIFFVKEGRIITPPVDAGILPGIMRDFVLKSFPVVERAIMPEEITDMEECFVTNSLMGIMPVNKLEGYYFKTRRKSEELHKKYSDVLQRL